MMREQDTACGVHWVNRLQAPIKRCEWPVRA